MIVGVSKSTESQSWHGKVDFGQSNRFRLKKRYRLLKQYEELQGVLSMSIEALCSVDGISRPLAQRIYDTFHPQDGS